MFRYETYCLSYLDLKPRPCPRPPQRAVVVEEINKEIVRKYGDRARCLATSHNRMPEHQWLLDALSALNPDHTFFQKDFYPERAPDPYLQIKIDYLKQNRELEHPLFRGLPLELLAKRKSLKSLAPAGGQHQVSKYWYFGLIILYFSPEPTRKERVRLQLESVLEAVEARQRAADARPELWNAGDAARIKLGTVSISLRTHQRCSWNSAIVKLIEKKRTAAKTETHAISSPQ